MDPLRIVVNVLAAAIGGLALWVAIEGHNWLNSAAFTWMLAFGVTIPIGVLALSWLRGWHPLTWGGFVIVVLYAGAQLHTQVVASVVEQKGEPCYTYADQMLSSAASVSGDLSLREIPFCPCLAEGMIKTYPREQVERSLWSRQWWRARGWKSGDAKINRILHICQLYDGSIVRAIHAIRGSGGDPNSPEMRSKLFSEYSHCVNIEERLGDDDSSLQKTMTNCLDRAG